MKFNTEHQRRKILWMVNIFLISIAMLIPAFADDLQNISVRLKSTTSYEYPYAGREHILGPEKTIYYAIHYDGNGKAQYGEVVRQADDFVLMRVYPDGTTEEFPAPTLTKKQKQDFINQYDPEQIKKRMLKEEKEMEKKIDKQYSDLIENNLIKLSKGDNYLIYMYTKPHQDAFAQFSSIFSDVNYDNTVAKDYDFNVETVRNKIVSKLNNANLKIPLKISLVPYQCEEFSQGMMQYRMFEEKDNQYGLHILLFNNKTFSMEEQFDIQFKKYLQEVSKQ